MADPIPVVVAADANCLYGLQTTLASAIVAEKSRPLSIHLLDGGVTDWQWQMVLETVAKVGPRTRMTRHKVDTAALAKFHTSREIPTMTYARMLTPSFVPDTYAIYIDCDFLVTRPMSDLLPHLDSGKAIVAAWQGDDTLAYDCPSGYGQDIDLTAYKYANGGLLLLNLEKWRRDDIGARTVAFLEKESSGCNYHDQTVINWLWRDDIEFVSSEWNRFAYDYSHGWRSGLPGQVNLHYATGMKPWKRVLPTLAHRIWWQFNRYYPPAAPPPNPLWNPRDLVRYLRYLGPARENYNQPPGSQLRDWDRYWKNLQAS